MPKVFSAQEKDQVYVVFMVLAFKIANACTNSMVGQDKKAI